jgi:chromosome segregation ATPase
MKSSLFGLIRIKQGILDGVYGEIVRIQQRILPLQAKIDLSLLKEKALQDEFEKHKGPDSVPKIARGLQQNLVYEKRLLLALDDAKDTTSRLQESLEQERDLQEQVKKQAAALRAQVKVLESNLCRMASKRRRRQQAKESEVSGFRSPCPEISDSFLGGFSKVSC